MDSVRVSPRHLGRMTLADFCARCYFFMVMMLFRFPFELPMPGLMYHLDIFEKKYVQAFLASEGELPPGMEDLGCNSVVGFPRKLTADFPKYDLTLVGMPDEVLQKPDGKLVVIDYKTAIAHGGDDPLLPLYSVQLLGYAELLERAGVGEVDSAAIVYFANESKDYRDCPLDLATDTGFSLPFKITTQPVELDRKQLEPLLKRFRQFVNMKLPPAGREKCRDCQRLQLLLDNEANRRGAEEYLRNRDGLARVTSRKLQREREGALAAWHEELEADMHIPTDLSVIESVPAAWDF